MIRKPDNIVWTWPWICFCFGWTSCPYYFKTADLTVYIGFLTLRWYWKSVGQAKTLDHVKACHNLRMSLGINKRNHDDEKLDNKKA